MHRNSDIVQNVDDNDSYVLSDVESVPVGIIGSILSALPTSSRTGGIDTDVPIQLRAKLSRQTQMAMAKEAKKKASKAARLIADRKRYDRRRKALDYCTNANKAIFRKYDRFVHDVLRTGTTCEMPLEDFIQLWQMVPDVRVYRRTVTALSLRRPYTQFPRTSLQRINEEIPYVLGNVKVMLYRRAFEKGVCIYPDNLMTDDPVVPIKYRKRRKKVIRRKRKKVAKIRRTKQEIIDFINSRP